jgi:hypothetical protein
MSLFSELPASASSFVVTGFEVSNGHKVAILRCNGAWRYYTASADASGFDAIDFHASRVFMSASRLQCLQIGDTLHADFHDGDVTFTLERGEA